MINPVYRVKTRNVETGKVLKKAYERAIMFAGDIPVVDGLSRFGNDTRGKLIGANSSFINSDYRYGANPETMNFESIGRYDDNALFPNNVQNALVTSGAFAASPFRFKKDSLSFKGKTPKTKNDHNVSLGKYSYTENTGILSFLYKMYHTTVISANNPIEPPLGTTYTFFHNSFSYFANREIGEGDYILLSSGKVIELSNEEFKDGNRISMSSGFTLSYGESATVISSNLVTSLPLVINCDIVISDRRGAHPLIFQKVGENDIIDYDVLGFDRRLVSNTFDIVAGDYIVVGTPTDLPYSPSLIGRDYFYNFWLGIDADVGIHEILEDYKGRSWDIWKTKPFTNESSITVSVYIGDTL